MWFFMCTVLVFVCSLVCTVLMFGSASSSMPIALFIVTKVKHAHRFYLFIASSSLLWSNAIETLASYVTHTHTNTCHKHTLSLSLSLSHTHTHTHTHKHTRTHTTIHLAGGSKSGRDEPFLGTRSSGSLERKEVHDDTDRHIHIYHHHTGTTCAQPCILTSPVLGLRMLGMFLALIRRKGALLNDGSSSVQIYHKGILCYRSFPATLKPGSC